jgi:glycerophosphoryl diester phosphodiesterase
MMVNSVKRLPSLVAHRGESLDAPENTIAAFDLAWQRGDDTIEMDVHSSADGQIVVCHDTDLGRTTKVSYVICRTRYCDLADHVPTLQQVLDRVPAGKRVFVEIKPAIDTPELVVDLLRHSAPTQVSFLSFHASVCRYLADQLPAHSTYFLVHPKSADTADGLLAKANALGVAGVNMCDGPWITRERIQRFQDAGKTFSVWTVDDAARGRQLADWKVDAITTNRAAWMRDQLAQAAESTEFAARNGCEAQP